jgi:hypothetical protein
MENLSEPTGLMGEFGAKGYSMVKYGGSTQIVKFYDMAKKLNYESEKAGRPIFKTVTHIHIITPGEKDDHDEEVKFENDEARERGIDKKGYIKDYPKEWDAYTRKQEAPIEGTPIDQWPNPALDAARVAGLQALNIRTVEQLAELSDNGLTQVGMGARKLQNQAKTWLKAAEGAAVQNELVAINQKLENEIASLKAQFRAQFGDEPEEPKEVKPKAKRRGRPKGAKNKKKVSLETKTEDMGYEAA